MCMKGLALHPTHWGRRCFMRDEASQPSASCALPASPQDSNSSFVQVARGRMRTLKKGEGSGSPVPSRPPPPPPPFLGLTHAAVSQSLRENLCPLLSSSCQKLPPIPFLRPLISPGSRSPLLCAAGSQGWIHSVPWPCLGQR